MTCMLCLYIWVHFLCKLRFIIFCSIYEMDGGILHKSYVHTSFYLDSQEKFQFWLMLQLWLPLKFQIFMYVMQDSIYEATV